MLQKLGGWVNQNQALLAVTIASLFITFVGASAILTAYTHPLSTRWLSMEVIFKQFPAT